LPPAGCGYVFPTLRQSAPHCAALSCLEQPRAAPARLIRPALSMIAMARSALPPYRAIAAALRERIRSGELLPGEQLPTVLQLCEQFGVSRNTALRALKLLRDEGLITSEPGWGAFVADPLPG
jgi:hypothetical protein